MPIKSLKQWQFLSQTSPFPSIGNVVAVAMAERYREVKIYQSTRDAQHWFVSMVTSGKRVIAAFTHKT